MVSVSTRRRQCPSAPTPLLGMGSAWGWRGELATGQFVTTWTCDGKACARWHGDSRPLAAELAPAAWRSLRPAAWRLTPARAADSRPPGATDLAPRPVELVTVRQLATVVESGRRGELATARWTRDGDRIATAPDETRKPLSVLFRPCFQPFGNRAQTFHRDETYPFSLLPVSCKNLMWHPI